MKNKFLEWLKREVLVLAVLAAAGVVWFVALSMVVPLAYEFLSRQCFLDYSYLWNGVSDKVRASATFGPRVLGIFYFFFTVARLLRGAFRIVSDERSVVYRNPWSGIFKEKKTFGQLCWVTIFRELFIAVLLVALCGTALYFSRLNYTQLKEKYFSEQVASMSGYQKLSAREKAAARSQYEQMGDDEAVDGMLRAYGFYARSVYHLQRLSFWLLIWGYPGLLVLRSMLWSLRAWREEN
jgi:hypothetical protein